jgi:CheY-like chemotaxis protein
MNAPSPIMLLLENDEADIFLFRRALLRLRFKGTLRVLSSVTEARSYLLGNAPFDDREYYPLPDMIVSDMSLSGETGNDFLRWLRRSDQFGVIPFVFLSGSFLPTDQARSVELGTSGFFAKTADMSVMIERVRGILKFLPPTPTHSNQPAKLEQ